MEKQILQKIEDLHYKFQVGMYFSGIKKIKGAILLWGNKVKDSYWNYASEINISEKGVPNLIKQVINFFKNKDRQPAIYITPFTRPRNLPNLIKKLGFKSQYKDAWMFYNESKTKATILKDLKLKKIETKKEMELFVKLFKQTYGGTTPEEPYGALPPEYGKSLFESFKQKQEDKKVVHYLGLLKNKPAGIATRIYRGRYGCLYNIGVMPNRRKLGVGSALTLSCITEAMKNKVKIIFLQTEKGSYNEKYYKKLGFSTGFIGEGFVFNKKD